MLLSFVKVDTASVVETASGRQLAYVGLADLDKPIDAEAALELFESSSFLSG